MEANQAGWFDGFIVFLFLLRHVTIPFGREKSTLFAMYSCTINGKRGVFGKTKGLGAASSTDLGITQGIEVGD